jgi:hypothetical protein
MGIQKLVKKFFLPHIHPSPIRVGIRQEIAMKGFSNFIFKNIPNLIPKGPMAFWWLWAGNYKANFSYDFLSFWMQMYIWIIYKTSQISQVFDL